MRNEATHSNTTNFRACGIDIKCPEVNENVFRHKHFKSRLTAYHKQKLCMSCTSGENGVGHPNTGVLTEMTPFLFFFFEFSILSTIISIKILWIVDVLGLGLHFNNIEIYI